MSLLSNFAAFKTGTYNLTRPSAGSYVAGVWVADGADTPSTFDATIQPSTSKDLELLPEGARVNGLRTVYTETVLEPDDRVTINSVEWKVIAIDEHLEFAGSGGDWNKAIIGRVPRQ